MKKMKYGPFDVVLREKPLEDGLTKSDTIELFDMLNGEEGFLVDIQGQNSAAMGFVKTDKYDEAGTSEFMGCIQKILNDMELESPSGGYTICGLNVYMSR